MKRFHLILIAFLLSIALVIHAATWAATEPMTYATTTDLDSQSGGSGWNGNWVCSTAAYIIQTAPSGMTGTAAKKTSTVAGKSATRALPASISAGQATFTIMVEGAAPNGSVGYGVYLRESTTNRMEIRYNSSGNITRLYGDGVGGSSVETVVSGASLGTAYVIDFEFDDAANPNQYRVRVNGGTWFAYRNVRGDAYTALTDFRFDDDSTNAHTTWMDAIGVTPSSSTVPGQILRRRR